MFVYGASSADDFAHAQSYGWAVGMPGFDRPHLRDNKDREIARINGVYGKLMAADGARLILGPAPLRDALTIEHTRQRHSERSKGVVGKKGAWRVKKREG